MAMKDMNIAKLTSTDLPLFNGITQDLFPAVETPVINYGVVSRGLSGSILSSHAVTVGLWQPGLDTPVQLCLHGLDRFHSPLLQSFSWRRS